ncbi:MAG: hypothetical protein J7L71_07355 [Spirochaetaceae bacterium]|nr:hypothetical protein [Spirochaetaceae bacterium]
MKKLILLIAVLLMLTGVAAFSETSGYYVKTIPIVKVYDHNSGYKIAYLKSNLDFAYLYIPKTWFATSAETGKAPKAELVTGKDSAYPYFSIFWNEGKFDHIRFYLQSNLNDPTWGDLNPNVDISEKFKVDTLNLEL